MCNDAYANAFVFAASQYNFLTSNSVAIMYKNLIFKKALGIFNYNQSEP